MAQRNKQYKENHYETNIRNTQTFGKAKKSLQGDHYHKQKIAEKARSKQRNLLVSSATNPQATIR